MRRIAIIPIRSGSKGLKNKNILPLDGKPLVSYSIEAAIKSQKFDKVFVSTDVDEYARIAMQYGADASFLRSKEMSSDTASSWDVVREVIKRLESDGEFYDEIMLLQATSPLRTAEDIINSINVMCEKNANSVESVTEMEHSPLWANTLPEDGCMDNFESDEIADIPRQLLPKYYRPNGAIFLVKREELDKARMFRDRCFAYEMPRYRSIDIDEQIDFEIAKVLLMQS